MLHYIDYSTIENIFNVISNIAKKTIPFKTIRDS